MMGTDAIAGVVQDMEGWAGRFLEAAQARDAPRAEEAVAGLVDWLGHDLVDAFLFMDVPTWEALSGLAEELFQAMRGAQAGIAAPAGAGAAVGVPGPAAAIGSILERARAIRDSREA